MITLRIYTTYDLLYKQIGLSLNETNLEYWRTRTDPFRTFSTREDKDILFFEKTIEEDRLYEHLKLMSQYNLTYELERK